MEVYVISLVSEKECFTLTGERVGTGISKYTNRTNALNASDSSCLVKHNGVEETNITGKLIAFH